MSRLEWNFSGEGSFNHKEHPVVEATNIPHVLKGHPRPQWVCWRYAPREQGKKPDKRPINPKTLGNAGPNWRNSWSTFDTAYATYLHHQGLDTPSRLDGVGFFLTTDDPYVAIDLDSCVTEEGITDPALEIVQELNSYTEISPSGSGIRILVTSPAPINNSKDPTLEMYSHHRYVTITGQHVDGTPLEIATVDPSTLESLRPPEQPPHTTSTINTLPGKDKLPGRSDLTWDQIFLQDKYGHQHLERFKGNLALDGNDHSLTVLRLLNCLARWTGGDPVKMRAMMLQSPLARDKWFSRRGDRDWLDVLIADSIRYVKFGK